MSARTLFLGPCLPELFPSAVRRTLIGPGARGVGWGVLLGPLRSACALGVGRTLAGARAWRSGATVVRRASGATIVRANVVGTTVVGRATSGDLRGRASDAGRVLRRPGRGAER